MKNKLISIFFRVMLSLCILVYSIGSFSLVSRADVPFGQIVVGHSGTWSGLPFTYSTNGKYYTIQDPTGIPTGTYLSPKYYYTRDNEKFFVANSLEVFTYALNKVAGIVFEPNELNNFFQGFLNEIKGLDTVNNKYAQTALYDSNDNFLGYALNDISGCYYGGNPPTGTNVKTDDNYVNNVKNYYDYSDYNSVDYFTFYGISNTYILRNYDPALTSVQLNYFNEKIEEFAFASGIQNYYKYQFKDYWSSGYGEFIGIVTVPQYGIYKYGSSYNNWNNFTKHCVNGNELLASDFVSLSGGNSQLGFNFYIYDSSNNAINQGVKVNVSSQTMTVINWDSALLQKETDGKWWMPFNFESLTIYKNSNVRNLIDTQLYSPDVFYTDSYNNYDSNNDNSIDAPISIINQSISNNSSIYDTSSENFYNYYDNGYYDQSSATTNITNITNNYYGNNDNPDNPDNPDDPSDVLSQILQALLRFFTAIGSVLGTILTGLLTIFSEILESIAIVTEDLTGISSFFGSIFSWIPDPVPQVLGLGFSICILCGIIKFIRG